MDSVVVVSLEHNANDVACWRDFLRRAPCGSRFSLPADEQTKDQVARREKLPLELGTSLREHRYIA